MGNRGFLYYLIMALVLIALVGGLVNTFRFPLWVHLVLAIAAVVIFILNLVNDYRQRDKNEK